MNKRQKPHHATARNQESAPPPTPPATQQTLSTTPQLKTKKQSTLDAQQLHLKKDIEITRKALGMKNIKTKQPYQPIFGKTN